MFSNKAVFTNAGRNLLAGIHNGGKLKITRAVMGDGTLGSQRPETLTDVLSPVVTGVMPKTVSAPFEGRVTVRFDSNTVDIPRDFYWREWGVFAQNVETGEEVLYLYNNAGTNADYITAGSGNTIILAQTIYIGTAANVEIVIDPSIAYALQGDFVAHRDDTTSPHLNQASGALVMLDCRGGTQLLIDQMELFARINIPTDVSPNNPGTIEGYDEVSVWVSDTPPAGEPYNGQDYKIELPHVVGGLPDYPDYIDFKRGMLVCRSYAVTYDGTETWTSEAAGGFRVVSTLLPYAGVSQVAVRCTWAETSLTPTSGINRCYLAGGLMRFYFLTDPSLNINNSADWKAYIAGRAAAGHPLKLIYALAEPIEIPLSDMPNPISLPGVNHIWMDAEGTLSVTEAPWVFDYAPDWIARKFPVTLQSGADLNNYVGEGQWASLNTAVSNTITHKPSDAAGWSSGFHLHIIPMRSNGATDRTLMQILSSGSDIFARTATIAAGGITWTAWRSVTWSDDTGWVTLVLESGWRPYEGTQALTPRIRRIGKVVHFVGAVSPPTDNHLGSGTPTQFVTPTLPAEYRPPNTLTYICQGGGTTIWTLQVSNTGIISAVRYRNGSMYENPADSAWMPFNVSWMVT